MHGKVNMVSSRGACTRCWHRTEAVGPRLGAAGEGVRARVYVNLPQVGCYPTRPGDPGPCSAAPSAVTRPDRGRALGFPVGRGAVSPTERDLAGKRPRPVPPRSAPSRPRERDHRTAAAAAKETFSPERPGSSALRQRGLRAPSLLFSKQAPGGHGMRGCSGIGPEFRIWRRPRLSLWAGSALLNPARLAAGWALPCLDSPPTPAVSFCPGPESDA